MRFTIAFIVLISGAYSADFTTYLGVVNQYPNQSTIGALTTDSAGNTYATGSNAFVTKLDPTGNIVFTTMLGPGASDSLQQSYSYGFSIALDPSGNIWIAGHFDGIVQKYTHDGSKMLLQIGIKGKYDSADGTDSTAISGTASRAMNSSHELMNSPTDVAVDPGGGRNPHVSSTAATTTP